MSATIKEMQAIRMAEDAVQPIVGAVSGQTSASAVYKEALNRLGVDHAGVTDAYSLSRIFAMAKARGHRPGVAMDSANIAKRAEMFPNANRLR